MVGPKQLETNQQASPKRGKLTAAFRGEALPSLEGPPRRRKMSAGETLLDSTVLVDNANNTINWIGYENKDARET